MGFGVTELLILLLIVALLFGTKKLRSLGSDVGSAVKGFRSAVKDDENTETLSDNSDQAQIIEGQAEADKNKNDTA